MFIRFFISIIKCIIKDFEWNTFSEVCRCIAGIIVSIIGLILVVPIEIMSLPFYLADFILKPFYEWKYY